MFWHLLLGPVIGGQTYRLPPISTTEWEEKRAILKKRTARVWPNAELSAGDKFTRENVVKQCGLSIEEDKFDWDNAIQKAEFSYAIAVMDRIEGWE